MERGVVGQPCKTSYFHFRHRHPRSWNDPSKNSVGPAPHGVRRFRFCLHKWDMASSAACERCAEGQTVDHVVLECPRGQ